MSAPSSPVTPAAARATCCSNRSTAPRIAYMAASIRGSAPLSSSSVSTMPITPQ